jgi:sulfite reductase (NADPH) flavoprotein alpha-component
LVPDSAPFTAEQRTWLNGFFAGFLELDGAGITAFSPEANAALMSGLIPAANGPLDDGDDGQAPWHDQALPLAERMKLADGRPLRRRMMAAMGQQDCGQCGYNCEDYSNVIFSKKEERLNLCVPGGKETARMLKTLYKELDEPPSPGESTRPSRGACRRRTLTRPSGRSRVSLAHAAKQAGVGKGDLAPRVRS